MKNKETDYDVIIVGAGWSGIVACKYMLAHGLSCLVLEKNNYSAGVWHFDESNTETGGVISSTRTTSSKPVTEMSDFPMPDDIPPFPTHTQILNYLESYIKQFNLSKNIKLNSFVESITKENNVWMIKCQKNMLYQSKFVIICSGIHQHPNTDILDTKIFSSFTNEIMHSCTLKSGFDRFINKNILIYGSGETASDIAVEISSYSNKLFLSSPNGQWIVSKYTKSVFHPQILTLDQYSSVLRTIIDPTDDAAYAASITQEEGKCGHGIKEWETTAPYQTKFFNKNAEMISRVHLNLIHPKSNIDKCDGNIIHFSDGSSGECDAIVLCTGYKEYFEFLPKTFRISSMYDNFNLIFHTKDPTLTFCGFARPIVGSITAMSEVQAICIAKVFVNEISLPTKTIMENMIQKDKEYYDKRFGLESKRISGLVDFIKYQEKLAIWSNIEPNYRELLKEHPKDFLSIIIAPHNNCKYLLNQDDLYQKALSHLKKQIHPVFKTIPFYLTSTALNIFPYCENYYTDRKFIKSRRVFSFFIAPIIMLINITVETISKYSLLLSNIILLPLFFLLLPSLIFKFSKFLKNRKEIKNEIDSW